MTDFQEIDALANQIDAACESLFGGQKRGVVFHAIIVYAAAFASSIADDTTEQLAILLHHRKLLDAFIVRARDELAAEMAAHAREQESHSQH